MVISMVAKYFNVNNISLGAIVLQMISLWLFFTVHTLFIYYIFQPYNDKYEPKSPAYMVMNILVYLVCYGLMVLSPSGPLVGPISIGVALLYVLVSLALVYKIAPKTFVIRYRK